MCSFVASFFHLVQCFQGPSCSVQFPFMAKEYSIVWICCILFINSAAVGNLGYFYLLAVVNHAALKIGVFVSIWVPACSSLGIYIPGSRIVWSYGTSRFNFLRSHRTVFHSGRVILHSYQQCMRVPVSSHPHQDLLFSDFLQ